MVAVPEAPRSTRLAREAVVEAGPLGFFSELLRSVLLVLVEQEQPVGSPHAANSTTCLSATVRLVVQVVPLGGDPSLFHLKQPMATEHAVPVRPEQAAA